MKEYSQQTIIEQFCSGNVFNEKNLPEHIETVMSHVFIFPKTVYKFYKNDNAFFNENFQDIYDRKKRFVFTRKDFLWNKMLSPSIYIDVIGITQNQGVVSKVSQKNAQELVMRMLRVDVKNLLFEKLLNGKFALSDAYCVGRSFGESFQKIFIPKTKNFYTLFLERVAELENWFVPVSNFISLDESKKYCNFLKQYAERRRNLFESVFSKSVGTAGDFHAMNALFSENRLFFMDTYAPKPTWLYSHKFIPLYRVGVDIWVLTGKKKYFESYLSGIKSSGISVDRSFDVPFVMYAAANFTQYLYMLQKTDSKKLEPAKKYHAFLRKFFEEHCKDV